jgi:predicted transcriptional regulator
MSVVITERTKQRDRGELSTIPTTIHMSDGLKFELQVMALKERTTLSVLVDLAVEDYLKKQKEPALMIK